MEKITFTLDKPGIKEVVVPLSAEGQEIEVFGLVEAREVGDYVVKVLVDHCVNNTFGRIVIRGIAENGARVRIDGMVKIEKEASKTDSFLEMRVLLLDNKSSATAEPKLEIENNNVKASHAATVGKIDEEQLFYLKSRGIMEQEAKTLLVEGFLKDIKVKMND